MMKKAFEKYNLKLDDFFLFFQILFSNLSIISVLVKLNKFASIFFYIVLVASFIWLAYKFSCFLFGVFKHKCSKIFLITSIIVLLLYIISIIITAIFIVRNNTGLLSTVYYEKTLIYLSAINFIYCSLNSKFNKALFYEAFFLSVLFLLLSFFLFVIGTARTWGGYGKWKNLTLNFANPNTAGLFLFVQSLIALSGFAVLKTIHSKIIIIAALITSAVLLYFTSSRTFLISLFFAIIFYALKRFSKNKKAYSLLISLIPLLFPLIYIFISYLVQLNTPENIQIVVYTDSIGKSLGSRITIWLWSLKIISKNPVFGSYSDSYFGHYHNTAIDSWITYGGVFTLLFIVLISISVYIIFNKKATKYSNIFFFSYVASIMTMISETTILYSSLGTSCLFLIYIAFSNMDFETCYDKYSAINSKCDVLVLTNVFKNGSIGKMTHSIYSFCRNKMSICVLYGRGKNIDDDYRVLKCCSELESGLSRILSKLFRNIYSFNILSTLNVIDFIKKAKVKVVNIHAINDYYINPYMLFRYLKRNNIKVIYTAHSGNLILSNCGGNTFQCPHWKENPGCQKCIYKRNFLSSYYWKKMYLLLKDFDLFSIVTVSNTLENYYRTSEITSNKKILTILDCVSDKFDYYPSEKNDQLCESKKNILLVIPSVKNPNKGFDYFVKLSKIITEHNFICVAYDIAEKTVNNNLHLIPAITDERILAELYSNCDLTLVLSKSETFCLPVAESLSCGTPVVGFKAGGPEEIAIGEYSSFVEYGDIENLVRTIKLFLGKKHDKRNISTESRKKYSESIMVESYYSLFKGELANYTNKLIEICI